MTAAEDRLRDVAAGLTGLDLLVLFGSRARGTARSRSDWDLGFLAEPGFDPEELRRQAALATGGVVDVVDLARGGALVRRRAADEGRPLLERAPDAYGRFQIEAAAFWCDAEPVLRRAFDAVLGRPPVTLPREVIAEKAAAVERHLTRVADRLPGTAAELRPMTDAADAVLLHLWQAVQIVVDLALSSCVALGLGAPTNYADGFRRLATAGYLEEALADRLARAAGFRNVIAHTYEALDLGRVFEAARAGPADLRAFLGAVARIAG